MGLLACRATRNWVRAAFPPGGSRSLPLPIVLIPLVPPIPLIRHRRVQAICIAALAVGCSRG